MSLNKQEQVDLSKLKPGQSGRISGFSDDDMASKLLEMGFIPGEEVTVSKIAAFGDPIIVQVADYHVSLRKTEAASVMLALS